MMDFLIKHKLINPSQHGFIKARSCLTNLLCFFEEKAKWVDEGSPVDVSWSSVRQWRQRRECEPKNPCGQKCPPITAGSRSACQWAGPIGRNTCVLAWSPCHTPVID